RSGGQRLVQGHKPGPGPGHPALPAAPACAHVACGDPDVSDGELLWAPRPEQGAQADGTAFTGWACPGRGLPLPGHPPPWRWSVTALEGFWQAVWDYSGIAASSPPALVLGSRAMPGAQWFPGARLNYAEHVLRNERPGADALLYRSETTPLAGLPWEEFAG